MAPGGGHEANYLDLILTCCFARPEMSYPARRMSLDRSNPVVRIGRTSKRFDDLAARMNNGFFDSPVMSRNHAQLSADFDNKTMYVTDLDSLHGTFIDGLKLPPNEPRSLRNGEMVRFGIDVSRAAEVYPPCTVEVQYAFAESRDAVGQGYNYQFLDSRGQPADIQSRSSAPAVFQVPDSDDDSSSDSESMDQTLELLRGTPKRPIKNKVHIDLTGDGEASSSSAAAVAITAGRNVPTSSATSFIDLTGSQQRPGHNRPATWDDDSMADDEAMERDEDIVTDLLDNDERNAAEPGTTAAFGASDNNTTGSVEDSHATRHDGEAGIPKPVEETPVCEYLSTHSQSLELRDQAPYPEDDEDIRLTQSDSTEADHDQETVSDASSGSNGDSEICGRWDYSPDSYEDDEVLDESMNDSILSDPEAPEDASASEAAREYEKELPQSSQRMPQLGGIDYVMSNAFAPETYDLPAILPPLSYSARMTSYAPISKPVSMAPYSPSAAEKLGEKSGKMDFFTAREENKLLFSQPAQPSDEPQPPPLAATLDYQPSESNGITGDAAFRGSQEAAPRPAAPSSAAAAATTQAAEPTIHVEAPTPPSTSKSTAQDISNDTREEPKSQSRIHLADSALAASGEKFLNSPTEMAAMVMRSSPETEEYDMTSAYAFELSKNAKAAKQATHSTQEDTQSAATDDVVEAKTMSRKRKADEISMLMASEMVDAAVQEPITWSADETEADVCEVLGDSAQENKAPLLETPASLEQTMPGEAVMPLAPQLPVSETELAASTASVVASPEESAAKRPRTMIETVGLLTLGGVTASVALLGGLIATAPSFT